MKLKMTCLTAISMILLSFAASGGALQTDAYYKNIAQAQVSIERLRKAEPVDWNKIAETYGICRDFVQEVDKESGTTYIADIDQSLKDCAAGKDVKVSQQILSKGLQHVVVLSIQKHFNIIGSSKKAEERKQAALNIAALFEGIRPTFVRRDEGYFKGTKTLELHAETAIQELVSTAETESNFIRSISRLQKVINRTYALSVLYELQEIEKLRKKDTAECAVKKAEAIIFYRIIEDRIKKSAPTAHKTLLSIINADYASVNSENAKKALEDGLKGVTLL